MAAVVLSAILRVSRNADPLPMTGVSWAAGLLDILVGNGDGWGGPIPRMQLQDVVQWECGWSGTRQGHVQYCAGMALST